MESSIHYRRIVGIDESGEPHTLWEEPDVRIKSQMPELETGMFIKLHIVERDETLYGFVYKEEIIWQCGSWDNKSVVHQTYNGEDDERIASLTIFKDGLHYYPLHDDWPVKWVGEAYYG